MIKIGLADDQMLVRAGFAMVLNSQDDMTVAWEAENGKDAVTKAKSEPVDIILMDIQMPVRNGIEATKEILATPGNTTRVVVLTTFDTDNYIIAAVEAGASGFLLKDTSPESLIESVRSVGEQTAVISPAATAKLFRTLRQNLPNPTRADINHGLLEPLTPREIEILSLMARGRSNQEISSELFISLPTVKTHVGKVLAKTNSRDRVHAVLFAFRRNLVTHDEILRDEAPDTNGV